MQKFSFADVDADVRHGVRAVICAVKKYKVARLGLALRNHRALIKNALRRGAR